MKAFRASPSLVTLAVFALLAACSSGGGSAPTVAPPTNNPGGSPPPASTTIASPSIGVSSQTVHAAPNYDNGSQSWYTGGVTAWASNAGDTSSGANGNNGIDGVTCNQMGEPSSGTQLHVHAFVGLFANGSEQAIPSAVGMKQPTEPKASGLPNDNYAIETAQCFYHLHTHDYSGIIHIEDSSLLQTYAQSGMPSYAKLQTLFDIWGEPINANTVGTFNGSVAIYIGTPSGKASNGSDIVTSYTPFDGDLRTIALGHHIAVWIVVGTAPSAGLPQVEFDVQD